MPSLRLGYMYIYPAGWSSKNELWASILFVQLLFAWTKLCYAVIPDLIYKHLLC